MNILVILAAVSVAVYGETCKMMDNQYSDKIKVQKSSEACCYTSQFANESHTLRELVSPLLNDENYKFKANVSLNLSVN